MGFLLNPFVMTALAVLALAAVADREADASFERGRKFGSDTEAGKHKRDGKARTRASDSAPDPKPAA